MEVRSEGNENIQLFDLGFEELAIVVTVLKIKRTIRKGEFKYTN